MKSKPDTENVGVTSKDKIINTNNLEDFLEVHFTNNR